MTVIHFKSYERRVVSQFETETLPSAGVFMRLDPNLARGEAGKLIEVALDAAIRNRTRGSGR